MLDSRALWREHMTVTSDEIMRWSCGAEIGGAMPPGSQSRDYRRCLRWDDGVAADPTTDMAGSGVIGPHQ